MFVSFLLFVLHVKLFLLICEYEINAIFTNSGVAFE